MDQALNPTALFLVSIHCGQIVFEVLLTGNVGSPSPQSPDFQTMLEQKQEECISYLEDQIAVLKEANQSLTTNNTHLHMDLKKNKEVLKMANAEVEVRTCCQDRLVEKVALMDAALLLAHY
jgi:hypothetical protein